jgi:hypothetical protein
MKLNLFGNKIVIINGKKLSKSGANAKKQKTIKKLKEALEVMKNSHYKYSEYRLQKISKLSINTIKKYRPEIEKIRKDINYI